MKPPRWTAISQSAFAWEREALDFARVHLPDYEPWRAWSNFEFVDDEGRVNEVDLLILTAAGLVLVEIKSRPGTVRGDAQTWTWTTDGRPYYQDNPLPLANRKAKRLASVLSPTGGVLRAWRVARPCTVDRATHLSVGCQAAAGYRSGNSPTGRAARPPRIARRRWPDRDAAEIG